MNKEIKKTKKYAREDNKIYKSKRTTIILVMQLCIYIFCFENEKRKHENQNIYIEC